MSSANFTSKAAGSLVRNYKKLVVLAGGVGPAAGNSAHDQLIKMTDNGRDKDQGHAAVLQTSFSGSVQDRTNWLLKDRSQSNPGNEMAKGINRSLAGFMPYSGNMVLGVPCNTFHAPEIWNVFISGLNHPDRIEIVNMIEETAKKIIKYQEFKNEPVVSGLMSTDGTRKIGVYSEIFKKYKLELLTLDDDQQKIISDAIYDTEFGIKGQNPDFKAAHEMIERVKKELENKGAQKIILGCTELPLPYEILGLGVPDNCLDPAKILIKELIRKSGHALKSGYASDDEDEPSTGAEGNDFLNLPRSEDGDLQDMDVQDMSKNR